MTTFLITSHADGGVHGLTIKGQRLGDGEDMLEFERKFAIECGTKLIVMHEFDVTEPDGSGAALLHWDEAKRITEAFWAGHAARGHRHLDERVHVASSGDMSDHAPCALVLGFADEIARLTAILKDRPDRGLWLEEVPLATAQEFIDSFVNYGRSDP
jgi:hypothetical protein